MACGCGGRRKERLAATKKVALTAEAQREQQQFGPSIWRGSGSEKEKTSHE